MKFSLFRLHNGKEGKLNIFVIFSERSPTSINPPRRLVANGRGSQQNRVNSFDTKKNCVEISPINLGKWRRVRFARPKLWNEFAYIVVFSCVCVCLSLSVCMYMYIHLYLLFSDWTEETKGRGHRCVLPVGELVRRGEYFFFFLLNPACLHATFSTRLYR